MSLFQRKIIKHPEPELEQLEQLLPFKDLDQEALLLLSKKSSLLEAKKGKRLFKEGSKDDWSYFLVSGELDLKDRKGSHKKLVSGTLEAFSAVSQLQPRNYTVTALTDISFIRMDKSLIENAQPKNEDHQENILNDATIKKATYQSNALYKKVHDDLMCEQLKLPNFKPISTQITTLLQSDDTDADSAAMIIQQHPILTAKLIKVANCPIYYGQKSIDTCKAAILRLGVAPTKSISLGILIKEQLQLNLKSPELQQRVDNIRVHCSDVAGISYVIAKILKGFIPEKAMLAGLVHDIGAFPILYYADQNPELINGLEHIDETIRQLSGELGALLLEKWDFPKDLISVAREADSWHRDKKPTPDYCDIVLIAQAYSFIGKEEAKSLPKLQEIPALKKLNLDQLTPQHSIKLLDQAKKEINMAKSLLG